MASSTPAGFAGVAEGFLKNNSGSCEVPYQRVGLRESGEYYTFLKKKERDFPCLGAAAR